MSSLLLSTRRGYAKTPSPPPDGIGASSSGGNVGASTVALDIAKVWCNRDLLGYAQGGWD